MSNPSPIRDEIVDLANRGNITYDEWKSLRMNAFEQEHILPHLTNDALTRVTKYWVKNCRPGRAPSITYDDAVIHKIVPILLERLEST